MSGERPAPIPVSLITGFLGAGKTTLLRALLASPSLADTAVLINEFGEVGLDHHLLGRIDETMVLLTSGCLCCTIRGELADSLRDLLSRRQRGEVPAFRRIVIETTGLADPYPILSTLHGEPVLRHHLRAGVVIAVVDAVNFAAEHERHDQAARQIASAHRIVLTKTDLAGQGEIDASRALIGALNPSAEIILRHGDGADPGWLLDDAPGLAISRFHADTPRPPHLGAIRSLCLTIDAAIDWQAFALWLTMLQNRHGERILRVKGVLNVAGRAAPVAIDGIRYLVHRPTHLASWPDEARASRLVFITDGLDEDVLRRSLETCLLGRVVS